MPAKLPVTVLLAAKNDYLLRLGCLEGRPGLIACQIRASYIAQTRAKIYELALRDRAGEPAG